MRRRIRFYLNLALLGFTVGQVYGVFQRCLARDLRAEAARAKSGH
ncbi:MAG TPA: hypothetical protein VME42_00890 [Steroidobacteraceae bacterium]|nr:hypothetical protein [Steroidobacteraceae bacterium]